MEDGEIIELYWRRSEEAILETQKKYVRYCKRIAFNILHNSEDAEECVEETYLRAWNAMPPHRPNCLSAFLGKITRNLALNKYRRYAAQKRGSGCVEIALSELEDCIPAATNVEQSSDGIAVREALRAFLSRLPREKRILFVQRYWYLIPVKEIAEQRGISESKVKSTLFRVRKQLKQYLEKEGITL